MASVLSSTAFKRDYIPCLTALPAHKDTTGSLGKPDACLSRVIQHVSHFFFLLLSLTWGFNASSTGAEFSLVIFALIWSSTYASLILALVTI